MKCQNKIKKIFTTTIKRKKEEEMKFKDYKFMNKNHLILMMNSSKNARKLKLSFSRFIKSTHIYKFFLFSSYTNTAFIC